MNFTKVSAMVFAVLAICAIVATSASAAVSTTRAEWYTGSGTGTTLSGSSGVNAMIAEHPNLGLKAFMQTQISELRVTFTSTGIECVECRIENKEVTSRAGAIAYGTGKLRFSGVTVMEPLNCTVSSEAGTAGQIITRALTIHGDWMDSNTANQHAFKQFIPPSESGVFAQFKLGGTGCEAISGAKNVTGSLFAESKRNTGELATTQELFFGPDVQETAGALLKVGVNEFFLTGTGKFSLSSGAAFGIH